MYQFTLLFVRYFGLWFIQRIIADNANQANTRYAENRKYSNDKANDFLWKYAFPWISTVRSSTKRLRYVSQVCNMHVAFRVMKCKRVHTHPRAVLFARMICVARSNDRYFMKPGCISTNPLIFPWIAFVKLTLIINSTTRGVCFIVRNEISVMVLSCFAIQKYRKNCEGGSLKNFEILEFKNSEILK